MKVTEYANKMIEIPVWRYESLLRKEAVYEFEREKLMRAGYRSEDDCIRYGVPTIEEEKEFNMTLEKFKDEIDSIFKKGE